MKKIFVIILGFCVFAFLMYWIVRPIGLAKGYSDGLVGVERECRNKLSKQEDDYEKQLAAIDAEYTKKLSAEKSEYEKKVQQAFDQAFANGKESMNQEIDSAIATGAEKQKSKKSRWNDVVSDGKE